MRPNKPDRPIVKPQSDRFIELARELGCDEDEAAFKAKLGKIAQQKPKDQPDHNPVDRPSSESA